MVYFRSNDMCHNAKGFWQYEGSGDGLLEPPAFLCIGQTP